jgi:hypothetical protein
MVVMGRHNFENEALIKIQRVGQKKMGQAKSSRMEINRVPIESWFYLLPEAMCVF